MLRKQNSGTLHRVCAAGEEAGDGSGHVGQNLDSVEGHRVENTGLVVVAYERLVNIQSNNCRSRCELHTNKDLAARENVQEWIEIVGVGAGEPIEVEPGVAATGCGEDLETGLRSAVTADLTAHDEDGAVGHDERGRVPALALQMQLFEVLLPVVCAVHALRAVGPVKPNALG